jgi:hypothetical protein
MVVMGQKNSRGRIRLREQYVTKFYHAGVSLKVSECYIY